ncbi:MAG: hypothetical protein ACRDRJ_21130, partial [Streptosporangiaceae bacterium]
MLPRQLITGKSGPQPHPAHQPRPPQPLWPSVTSPEKLGNTSLAIVRRSMSGRKNSAKEFPYVEVRIHHWGYLVNIRPAVAG